MQAPESLVEQTRRWRDLEAALPGHLVVVVIVSSCILRGRFVLRRNAAVTSLQSDYLMLRSLAQQLLFEDRRAHDSRAVGAMTALTS